MICMYTVYLIGGNVVSNIFQTIHKVSLNSKDTLYNVYFDVIKKVTNVNGICKIKPVHMIWRSTQLDQSYQITENPYTCHGAQQFYLTAQKYSVTELITFTMMLYTATAWLLPLDGSICVYSLLRVCHTSVSNMLKVLQWKIFM